MQDALKIFRVGGAKVKVVATDRHVSIKSDIKRNFPDIDHQLMSSI